MSLGIPQLDKALIYKVYNMLVQFKFNFLSFISDLQSIKRFSVLRLDSWW